MTAKEEFLKFINNASDQTLAMVFYLCKRYLPEKVDDYKEVASGEFIAELVKEMNTERSEDDLKESGSAPELTHNERFLGVFDSLVSIRTSPRDGDTAVLSGAETHWVFFNGTWSCVDKTPITVRTTQTLYFDYDGDTWDVESPKPGCIPMSRARTMRFCARVLFLCSTTTSGSWVGSSSRARLWTGKAQSRSAVRLLCSALVGSRR